MNNKPLFSVVTVCFNAENFIKKTIESVLAQADSEAFSQIKTAFSAGSCSYSSLFEYIIQDGMSKDGTVGIAKSYVDKFAEKGASYIVNSEKDGGIYDAMNKAVQAASGEYVIFMNADDCFYSENVLSEVYKSVVMNNSGAEIPDIIYGDCIIKELGMYFAFRKCFEEIKMRMPFSHQACFAKRSLLLETPLDTQYRITADYNFLLKSFLNGKEFKDSNVCIALVTADGLSSVHMLDTFVEVNKVCRDLGAPRYDAHTYEKKLKTTKLKQFVLSYFPSFIKKAIRKNQIKKRGQITEVTLPPWAEL